MKYTLSAALLAFALALTPALAGDSGENHQDAAGDTWANSRHVPFTAAAAVAHVKALKHHKKAPKKVQGSGLLRT